MDVDWNTLLSCTFCNEICHFRSNQLHLILVQEGNVRIDGLNKKGVNYLSKIFANIDLRMNLYQTITDKKLRKAIKQ